MSRRTDPGPDPELGEVAPRPEPRTVVIGFDEGRFAGWRARVVVEWPASLIEEFESKDAGRILAAADALIVAHNFPDAKGAHAKRLADVDPFQGVAAVIGLAMRSSSSLPPG